MSAKYDLTVIGAGPGGYTAAISAAQYGMRVAIIEAREPGGACLNRGCIPTKTLMHSAEVYHEIKNAESIGVFAENAHYDIDAMYRRKDEVVSNIRDGIESLLNANKITLLYGKATILSANEVSVAGADDAFILETNKILIAAGAEPARPPIAGIGLPGVITSNELLGGKAIDYKSLIIIGGGVIGVEFATVFTALGCEVTIIEAMDRIIPPFDREISQNLSMILKKRGVSIFTGSTVERITETDGGLCCRFSGKNGDKELTAQGVLVAVGRTPNFDGLFASGVDMKRQRGLIVDENFETSIKGIYAVGDVIEGSIQLAHAAMAEARNAVAAMAGDKPPVDLSIVPSCAFTSPEIASVGLTADQAKEKGIAIKTGKYVMSGNAKTIIEQQDRGFVKLIFDAQTDMLIGAQLMCARACDIVNELSTAILNRLTSHQLASVVRAHPTFAEAVTEAADDAESKAVHIMPKAKK